MSPDASPPLAPSFLAALEADRARINAQFAAFQAAGARIDPAEFLAHLRDVVGPLVATIERERPERAGRAASELTDVSLELFAAALLGPDAKTADVTRLWREALPAAATLVAFDPRGAAGRLSNAAVQVARHRGARGDAWRRRLVELLPRCPDAAAANDVGVVLAWQAGLAQYRAAALEAAARLPAPLASPALGLAAAPDAVQLAEGLAELRRRRWRRSEELFTGAVEPPREARGKRRSRTSLADQVKIVRCGAYRGFGGPFQAPPRVSLRDGRLLASDGCDVWQVFADAYGEHFQRIESAGTAASETRSGDAERPVATLGPRGRLQWGDDAASLPAFAASTSQAYVDESLAVTLATSHHVFFLVRDGGAP